MASPRDTLVFDDTLLSCLFLAGISSAALWSIGCLQVCLYYDKFSKTDRLWLKLYVFLTWALDTVHQGILLKSLFTTFVKEFANVPYLAKVDRYLTADLLITAIINAMIQSFFVVRAWNLSNKKYLLVGTLVAVLAQFAIYVAFACAMYSFMSIDQLLQAKVFNTARAVFSLSIFTDIFISVTLMYFLWNLRSGIKKMDSVIRSLIAYAVGTGLITGLFGVAALIGSIVMPMIVYLSVIYVIPKIYFNCMLASLNARSHLQESLASDTGLVSIHLDATDVGIRKRRNECKFDVEVSEDSKK